jgi:quercetin dioxygenase-like cupin family protein
VRDEDVVAVDEYPVPVTTSGAISSKLMSPADYELWLVVSDISEGATLTWDGPHSEQILYVFEGALEVAGQACPAGGAIVIEADVATEVRATAESRIGHYGSRSLTPPDCPINGVPEHSGHGVHVVGPGGLYRFGERATIAGRWLADGRCATCRAVLFEVARDTPRQGKPHHHSADEIIYVVEGSVKLGALEMFAGSSLCIPGSVRYAEASGENGAVFLNFRPTGSLRTDFFKDAPPETDPEAQSNFDGYEIVNDVVHIGAGV